MKLRNTSPMDSYDSVQYKLDAYFEDLPETGYQKKYIEDKIARLGSNLLVHNRKGIYYLKQKYVCCLQCSHKEVVENGHYTKKLIYMDKGIVDVKLNDMSVNIVELVFQQILHVLLIKILVYLVMLKSLFRNIILLIIQVLEKYRK